MVTSNQVTFYHLYATAITTRKAAMNNVLLLATPDGQKKGCRLCSQLFSFFLMNREFGKRINQPHLNRI